jgi:hypothetical protein
MGIAVAAIAEKKVYDDKLIVLMERTKFSVLWMNAQ